MGSVVVRGVSKRFHFRQHGRSEHKPHDPRLTRQRKDFWALNDISFDVAPGEMYGIIGPNGAGKSTLLRLVGGVGKPTTGAIHLKGQIGALLELGSDFHPELTGRENVLLSGIIAGLTRSEVARRMDAIVDFAELREFIDAPVRTYSSGMLLRLAFGMVANTEPDVLLIDEVLAVGDQSFRAKCLNRIEEFHRRGCAILLVTHDTRLAEQLCDEVMWLAKGRIVQTGAPEKVVQAYAESMDWETKRRTPAVWQDSATNEGVALRMMENRFGSMEVQITDVRLLDARGYPGRRIHRGEPLRVEIDYSSDQPVTCPNFGIIIRQANNTPLFDETVAGSQLGMTYVHGSGSVALSFDRLDLNSGEYTIDVGLYRHDWAYAYDYHWRAYPLAILANSEARGALNPPHEWEKAQPRTRARIQP